MAIGLQLERRMAGPTRLRPEASVGTIVCAIGLAPGRPVPQIKKTVVKHYERVSWWCLLKWAPLFIPVLAVNMVFSVPPLLLFAEALQQTKSVFFGDDARLPWEI